MIVQHRNQANRECLYAWYPEAVSNNVATTLVEPRDIYIHTGIDRTLLVQQNPQGSRRKHLSTLTEKIDRSCWQMRKSILIDIPWQLGEFVLATSADASTNRLYHSNDTIDEALRTPWALDFDIVRRPATPNLPTQTIEGNVIDWGEKTERRALFVHQEWIFIRASKGSIIKHSLLGIKSESFDMRSSCRKYCRWFPVLIKHNAR